MVVIFEKDVFCFPNSQERIYPKVKICNNQRYGSKTFTHQSIRECDHKFCGKIDRRQVVRTYFHTRPCPRCITVAAYQESMFVCKNE